jgi:hypothetical protein
MASTCDIAMASQSSTDLYGNSLSAKGGSDLVSLVLATGGRT